MRTHSRRDERIVCMVLAAVPVALGLLALWLGQDNSWDLRNYHYYNVFAFLTGRMGYDIAVAHAATYYNPLLHIPFYFAVNGLPPRVVGFTLGALQGCNVFLLYAIGRRVMAFEKTPAGVWITLSAALLGLAGAVGIAETGTSFGDNVVSLPVLAAVWLIVRMDRPAILGRVGWGVALLAGLLAGGAFGLKQPFAVYAIGLCIAFSGLALPWRRRLGLSFIFGLGVLAGLALTGGFWMTELWQRFQNPLFPYFNQYFHSPWVSPDAYRDERFLPKNGIMALLFPLWIVLDPLQVSEVPFRDLRLALLFLLLIAWLVKSALSYWGRPAPPADPSIRQQAALGRFLTIFMAVSFVLWMLLFGVYRYLVVCEMLAPLALVWLAAQMLHAPRYIAVLAGSFILMTATLQPADWGRSVWGDAYFGVQAPPLDEPQHTVVLVSGFDPMAYMIPFFPHGVRFLRIHGYMTGPSPKPHATDRLMQTIIAAHKGPLFILYRSFEEHAALQSLVFHGLALERQECRAFIPSVEPYQGHPFYFCKVIPSLNAEIERNRP